MDARTAQTTQGERRLGRVATACFIAWRNLTGERRRWAISAAALGIAACLVLFLEGVSAWITDSATAYVHHTGATLVVAERGIDDLLFAQSSIKRSVVDAVGSVPGVSAANPVVTVNGLLPVKGTHVPVYIVGFDAGAMGGPWQVGEGSPPDGAEQAVVDRGLASIAGLRVGGTMNLFAHQLQVSGVSDGTDAAGDFFVFVSLPVAQAVAGQGDNVSYVLVRVAQGADAGRVATEIDALPGVHALTTAQLASNDEAAIVESFDQPLQIIVLVALIIGVLIAAIVLYTATVEHMRDFAVLKAIGASRGVIYGSALVQCLILTFCGLLLGFAVALGLSEVFSNWYPVLESDLNVQLVATVSAVVLAANLCGALLPVRQLRRVDPQEVFKA